MGTPQHSIKSFLQEWIVANSLESTLTINTINLQDVDPLRIQQQEQLNRKHQIDSFCRLCLCEPTTSIPLQSLMGDVLISDMFTGLTGIRIDFTDPYPKQLCTVCLGKLEKAYEIRKEFLENATRLESYFGGGNVVIKEEALEVEIKEEPEWDCAEPATSKMDDPGGAVENSSGSESASENAEADESQKSRRRSPTKRVEISKERSVMDPFMCYVCKTKFNEERELNNHLPLHADMLPYTCEICGSFQKKTITSVVLLLRHFRMHAGTVECPQCPIRFFSRDRLYAHKTRFHSRVKFTCEKCGHQLNNKENYQMHMARHKAVEEGLFTCRICDIKFGNTSRLKRHELIHQEKNEYQCQYCPKSFNSKTYFLTHEREHVNAGDLKQYACAFCDERFASNGAKARHVQVKHPELVERRFATGRTAYHGAGHNEQPFKEMKCPFEGCDFVAHSYIKLYHHKNRHLKRFKCPECHKCFPDRTTLKIHQRIHLDRSEWPYVCEQCGKRFMYMKRFKEHMHVHTGSKPYLCTECGESFPTKQHLANHELKKAPPQHKCHICSREFRYKGDYARHMRKHKEEDTAVAGEGIL